MNGTKTNLRAALMGILKSMPLLAAFLASPICGYAKELRPVVMQLDWIFNAQFAGLYQAIEQGYFADEGLQVELRPWSKEIETVDAVMAEELPCFGSAEGNVLIKERAAGEAIVALGAMFRGSPMGWMYLQESGIQSPADFEGKRIGIHPDGDKVIRMVFARYDLDLSSTEILFVSHDVNQLLRKEIDVMQGYYIDEYVHLQTQGKSDAGMIMAKDHGYSAYSQVVFAPEALVASEPELVNGFLRATSRGWEYALANRATTVDLILSQYNPDLDRAYQLGSLDLIAELVKPEGTAAMAPMSWSVWMNGYKMLRESETLKEPLDLLELLRYADAQ